MAALSKIVSADLAALAFVPLLVLGIHWMRSPATAVRGNALGAIGMVGFVALTLHGRGLWSHPAMWGWLAAGTLIGGFLAARVRMIQMPELVALFNGIGGVASAIVAMLALSSEGGATDSVARLAAFLAVSIGALTFSGSVVAVLKLARVLRPRPVTFPGHGTINTALLTALLAATLLGSFAPYPLVASWSAGALVLALAAGLVAMLRVGGADMPVSISFLNALSGVAAAVAGYALANPVPVAVGALVGAGGLMLTGDMCRAMNRRLGDVLAGRHVSAEPVSADAAAAPPAAPTRRTDAIDRDPVALLRAARRVVIIPGYGMALAQAQPAVRRLYDALMNKGVEVEFGLHPVAGRMPGHMHILLAEVEIPYEKFKELDDINPRLPETDVALVVGANDVVNPAANTVEGTPISGMPVIRADTARAVVVCNLDRCPGYAGVPNPLYDRPNVILCLGDAAETIGRLAAALEADGSGKE